MNITAVGLSRKIKCGIWGTSFLKENIKEVRTIYNLNNPYMSDDNVIDFILYVLLKDKKTISSYKSYTKDCMDFELTRFIDYTKKRNKIANASQEFYNLKYGKFGTEKFKNYCNKINAWDVHNYAKNRNITPEEARQEIKQKLKNKCTSLEGFVARHGRLVGTQKYEDWLSKCDQTKAGYIKRYGAEKGIIEYNNNIKKLRSKNPRCEEYWALKGKTGSDIKKCISDYQLNHAGAHKQFWIKRLGEEAASQKMKCINKNKDASSLTYFKTKFGDTEAAYAHYNEACQKKDAVSLKSFLARGYCLEEAKRLHAAAVKMRINPSVSNESRIFFNHVLNQININFERVYMDKNEYFLYDKNSNSYYLYDLALINGDKKCIIEYHGVAFHPSLKLNESQYKAWKSPYSKENADTVRLRDQNKKQLAQKNGFSYLEIWSDDLDKINTCVQFIKEIFKYEN